MNDSADEKQTPPGSPMKPPFGGEVAAPEASPAPRWLLVLSLALYAFAIAYLLYFSGDRWVIRIFAAALTGWAVYSCRPLFR